MVPFRFLVLFRKRTKSVTFFETQDLNLNDRHQYVPKVLPLELMEWLDDESLDEVIKSAFAYHGQIKHADYLNSRRIELKGDYKDLRVRYLTGGR